MDISSVRWMPGPEIDDLSFIHQYHMNSLDGITDQQIAAALEQEFHQSLSSEKSYSSYPATFNPTTTTTTSFSGSTIDNSRTHMERPTKQLKTNSWNSCITEQTSPPEAASSSPHLLSFGNSNSPVSSHEFYRNLISNVKPKDEVASPGNMSLPSDVIISHGSYANPNHVSKAGQGIKRASPTPVVRPPSHTQDHIIAERRRREKLSERFIALSAIVPGLKKMDKASVLGDSIKYMKQLQERVKILEEQTTKKTVESVVFVKKFQLTADDDSSSSDENFDGSCNEPLPEIEARVCDKNLLIRIHCEKHKGILVKTLGEIEKHPLTVANCSVVPFGNSALDITIVAQMDVEFRMTVKDLVRNLRSAFQQFM